MKTTPYGRNEAIYEKVKNGMTQTAIAKEFGLTSQRVYQICREQERRENRPYINEILAKKYPGIDPRSISVAVNALMRRWEREWRNESSTNCPGRHISMDIFIQLLERAEERGDLQYARGIGDGSRNILKMILEDVKHENQV